VVAVSLACYYRYPTGEFAVIDPGYCN
jgi:hypothetical protein